MCYRCHICGNKATMQCLLCLKKCNGATAHFCGSECYKKHFEEHRKNQNKKTRHLQLRTKLRHPNLNEYNETLVSPMTYYPHMSPLHSHMSPLHSPLSTPTFSPSIPFSPYNIENQQKQEFLYSFQNKKNSYRSKTEEEEEEDYMSDDNDDKNYNDVMNYGAFEKSNVIHSYSGKQTKNKMGYCFAPQTSNHHHHHMNQGWYNNSSKPFVRQYLIPFIQYLPNSCYFVYK